MREILKRYGTATATIASGIGPRIAFAPEKEGDGGQDGGDGGAAGENGGGGNGEGGKDGAGSGAEDGASSSALKGAKGLLGARKGKEGEGDGQGEGDGGKPEPKAGADGRPAHVPEKFWDPKTKAVKTDDLGKAYAELEKSFGKLKREKGIGADVPESADEYFADGLDLGDDVDRLTVDGPDDPGLKAWGKIAHKYGIGKEAAINIARDMMRDMNQHAPAPLDIEAEREALGSGADELIDGVFVWLEGQERAGKLGENEIRVALDLGQTADGIRFLSKMRSLSGAAPIPVGLPSGSRGMSQEDWHSEMREAVKAKDYKRQQELDDMSGKIFGDEAASGSPIAGIPNQKDVDRSARK